MRKTTLAVLSVILGLMLTATSAQAHVFTAGTTLTAKKAPGPPTDPGDKVLIFGKLKSAQADCRAGETVALFKKKRGPDRRLGTDVTDSEGEYRFKLRPNRSMRVYTRFAGSVDSSYGHSHTCQGSTSDTVRVRVQR
jgi:hypothetical protein